MYKDVLMLEMILWHTLLVGVVVSPTERIFILLILAAMLILPVPLTPKELLVKALEMSTRDILSGLYRLNRIRLY
jgi:hypothetical protein